MILIIRNNRCHMKCLPSKNSDVYTAACTLIISDAASSTVCLDQKPLTTMENIHIAHKSSHSVIASGVEL